MNILSLSDVHGNGNISYKVKKWIDDNDVEIVVISGDITHFGPAEWARDFVKSIVGFGVDVVGVPGNCDPPEVVMSIEEGGGVSVHEKRADVRGLSFAGVGGANPAPFPSLYTLTEEEIGKGVEGLLKDLDVFVSHAPPFGKNDIVKGGNAGSRELAGLLDQWKPQVVLTGHIHESRGVVEENGVVYMNPGPAREGKGGLVRIDGDSVEAQLL